jgi:hypothetical protein
MFIFLCTVFDDYEYYGLTDEEVAHEKEKLREIIRIKEKLLYSEENRSKIRAELFQKGPVDIEALKSTKEKMPPVDEEGIVVNVHTTLAPDLTRPIVHSEVEENADVVKIKSKNADGTVVLGMPDLLTILKKRAMMRIMKVSFFFFSVYLCVYEYLLLFLSCSRLCSISQPLPM